MRSNARIGILCALLMVLVAAGWRITHVMRADAALAREDVDTALQWLPAHPEALLQRAESQLARKQAEAAAGTARQLLRASPTEGSAYRVLAQVAELQGQRDLARKLFNIAARRAPRDLAARAWLAQDALERGVPAEALVQIDYVLTLSPNTGAAVYPVLVKLSADPVFADALAGVLRRPPAWRAGMLAALQRVAVEDRAAADQVFAALQRNGGFDAQENDGWIQSLLGEGRWGEAYARWASPLMASGKSLPLLFNGNFSGEPDGSGFDWLLPPTPGVIIEFEPGKGNGRNLHVRFLGRRVVGTFLQHRLMLAPGHYELRVRLRADALRSDHGLDWSVSCEGAPIPLASSEAFEGSRNWTSITVPFTVPDLECPGQWARMGNAGAQGAGQLVTGDVWIESAMVEGMNRLQAEHNSAGVAASQ